MKDFYDSVSFDCSRLITQRYSTSFSLGTRLLSNSIRFHIYNINGFVRFADEIVDSFHDFNKFELLNILSFENIFYFIYKKMKRIFFFKKKKFVLIFREDHLLREICTYLFLNGIEGRFFSPKIIDHIQNFDDLNFQ